MKITKIVALSFLTLISLMLLSCQSAQKEVENKDVLYQYSALGSLMEGVYDGEMTFSELGQHGDTGLGTFNTLDGEMIEIDQQFYQIKSDGVAYPVSGEMKTPFSAVTFFEPDQTVTVSEQMDCAQLKEYLDSQLPTRNIPYAFKIEGTFEYIKTRSVPSQEKPYIPLLEVLKTQPTFEFNNVTGAIVGFRMPEYIGDVNAPGYHFHFITQDRTAGGHLLECRVQNINVEVDYTGEWYTVLPQDEAFYNVEMSGAEYQ